MSKKSSVAKAINPETGKIDVKGAVCHYMKKLNEEDGIVRGGLYHSLSGGMQHRLRKLGVPAKYLVDFLLLLQELHLVRYLGGGQKIVWHVACMDFFEDIVSSDALVKKAIAEIDRRHNEHADMRQLEADNKKLKATSDAYSEKDLQDMTEKMAMLVAEINSLRDENAKLKSRLEESKKVDHKAVANQLVNMALKNK